MSDKLKKALFLDRDGVINLDHGYVYKTEDFEFIDGIFDLCKAARKKGYLIFVVTNQSGIGRGLYTEQDFHALTKWMEKRFAEEGTKIDKVYYCPYHEEHGIGKYKKYSNDRKPNPGMILKAEKEFGIDLSQSIILGDNEKDIEAGIAAGIGLKILFPGEGEVPKTRADRVVESLSEVIKLL